ncbi:oligoribonuclease [Paeniglutamicibacter antarcticus]|uniref:Oligoribonuclease n=1 Tax=Arthrobacter terrae TaxID=2935737 RepID=A0A931CPQ8_9MICC|nr:oligoribonuclease [Arthrobacter terrae]MBG0738751.1 oligoribonuclease [Arthrobacter terrae]
MSSIRNADNILWLDFETTGIMTNPNTVPLEGAAIITDGQLNELATLQSIALTATEEELSHMGDFVLNMHTTTGLLERVHASAYTRSQFDDILHSFAAPFFPAKGEILEDGEKYRGIVIGGNSVKFDFDVIEKFFPLTRSGMDYRVIDISGIGELVRRWDYGYWKAMPAKKSDHTALTDIRAGVDELRYYRAGLHLLGAHG